MHIAELVPQVPAADGRRVAAAQQFRAGERFQHPQVRRARLVQPGQQAVNGQHPGGGRHERGLSNREIARLLHVSEKTVKTHVSSVLAKLGVQDRTQAALYAVRNSGR